MSDKSKSGNNHNRKSENEQKKKTPVAVTAVLCVLVIACIGFMAYILHDIFLQPEDDGGPKKISQNAGDAVNSKTITDSEGGKTVIVNGGSLTVTLKKGNFYAGGYVDSSYFDVKVSDEDGERYLRSNEYACEQLASDFRLSAGINTYTFLYDNMEASIDIEAVDITSLQYSPNYIIRYPDSNMAEEIISQVNRGEGQYKNLLAGWGYIGDSQIAALSLLYDLADKTAVMAEVGSGLDYIFTNYETSLSMLYNKNTLVIHTGINELAIDGDKIDNFVERYGMLIDKYKTDRPDLRIIVDGIFPVSPSIVNSFPGYSRIEEANKKLCKMCMEKGIEFISDYQYTIEHPEFFGPDGLHMNRNFYIEYWMENLVRNIGG